MARRPPPERVKIKGVSYVPESPEAITRRLEEREERIVLKRISTTVAMAIARTGESKPNAERMPGIHHYTMERPVEGLNCFEFEGSLVLPPKNVPTDKGAMAVFVVGYKSRTGPR